MGTLHSHTDDALLLFGSQALSFDTGAFNELRSSIVYNPEHAWIIQAVKSLPACWASFAHSFPAYEPSDATRLALDHLVQSFETGLVPVETPEASVPNVVLSPLVVITHIVEYTRFLGAATSRPPRVRGALGFCVGLLSAYAVSSSRHSSELRRNGANAIRLAMIIGGIVDAQGLLDPSGKARALATAWSSAEVGAKVDSILERFSDVRLRACLRNNEPSTTDI